jgi:5-methylthioribose kinase
MAPTTDLELRHYLNSKAIPCSEVEALTGGTANFVWRIRTLLGRSSVVKHAEPFIKTNENFKFPVVRMDFEARALEVLFGVVEGEDGDGKFCCLSILFWIEDVVV